MSHEYNLQGPLDALGDFINLLRGGQRVRFNTFAMARKNHEEAVKNQERRNRVVDRLAPIMVRGAWDGIHGQPHITERTRLAGMPLRCLASSEYITEEHGTKFFEKIARHKYGLFAAATRVGLQELPRLETDPTGLTWSKAVGDRCYNGVNRAATESTDSHCLYVLEAAANDWEIETVWEEHSALSWRPADI